MKCFLCGLILLLVSSQRDARAQVPDVQMPAELVDKACGPIEVMGGKVKGTLVKLGQKEFCTYKGIPYAKAERWGDPGPADSWTGQKGLAFGPQCPQSGASGEEDCLNLNIWQPAGKRDRKLPVMVWIHGGAFVAFRQLPGSQ